MTDTGWPLIPREVFPAPVPAARPRPAHSRAGQPRVGHGPDASRQLSIFGAETTEPSPADLAGLLAGPGRLGRMGGTARVSVTVDAAWRVHVLAAELVGRGLVVTWRPVEPADHLRAGGSALGADAGDPQRDGDGMAGHSPAESIPDALSDEAPVVARTPVVPRFEVRTAYSRRLNDLARAWPEAAAKLFLSGPRLRLWVAAAGEPVAGGYALGVDPDNDAREIDAALVRAGLAGRVSDDGRYYLISGRRRLARLAELVGERPSAAPAALWPGGAAA